MKKLFYPLFALAVLAMTNTSCQDELENVTTNANEVDVTFKVQLENAASSRAVIGDGTTATELQYAVYKVAEDGKSIGTIINALSKETTVKSDLTAEVKFTLVKGQTYNFMFWAQKPGVSATDAIDDNEYYKLDKTTGKITVSYAGNANDEGRDAFYAVEKSLKVTGPINKTIKLKRPFAQINVGTAVGSLADAKTADVIITKTDMVISEAATTLNFFDGTVGPETEKKVKVSYDKANIPENVTNLNDGKGDLKDVTLNGVTKNYEYLAMNYILVNDQNGQVKDGAQSANVNVEFTVYDDAATPKAINTFKIPNVTVQRNYRTNIIGDILNENVTFNVVIDAGFDNDHNYDIAQELAYAAQNGGTVTLQKNVTLSQALTVTADMIVNLNGHDITVNSTDPAVGKGDGFIVTKGHLTINGEGTVKAFTRPVWARGDGGAEITINGGTYIGSQQGASSEVIYASGNGKVTINGGTFEALTKCNELPQQNFTVLNLHDGSRSTASILVKGGKFKNFDPANNKSEGNNTSFVAPGYKSVSNGDASNPVYEVCVDVNVAAGGTAELQGNGVILEKVALNGGTLNGNGHTLTVAEKPNTNYLIHATNDATIEHLTIAGDDQYSTLKDANGAFKSTRALMFETIGDIVINDVHVSGVGYALNVNCASTNPSHTLKVSNSTLVGWTSYGTAVKTATFTKVHFGIGTYFGEGNMWSGGIRPYANTTFDNCTFDKNFVISFAGMSGSGSFTFKNCSVEGTKINGSNWTDYLKTDGTMDGVTVNFQ